MTFGALLKFLVLKLLPQGKRMGVYVTLRRAFFAS